MHQWLRIGGGIVVSVQLFLGNTVTMSVDMLEDIDRYHHAHHHHTDEQKDEVIT